MVTEGARCGQLLFSLLHLNRSQKIWRTLRADDRTRHSAGGRLGAFTGFYLARGLAHGPTEGKGMKHSVAFFVLASVLLMLSCSQRNNVSYKDDVKKALEQAELKDVTVSEDQDKNTITLGGTLHSDDAKAKAADVARVAANTRIIANEISVQPVGSEPQARAIASNLDEGIEKNYRAALISSGLDKQHVTFNAKNGLITLTGSVRSSTDRQLAQKLASEIPNVQQVLNQIAVRR